MSNVPEGRKFTSENAREMGAKGGRNKAGSLHLSTIIQELAEDIDWEKTTLKNKDELKAKYGKNGFKAVAYVALTKAMTGDVKAMEWLAKHGYGSNINVNVNRNPIDEILSKFGITGGDDARETEDAPQGTSETSS